MQYKLIVLSEDGELLMRSQSKSSDEIIMDIGTFERSNIFKKIKSEDHELIPF